MREHTIKGIRILPVGLMFALVSCATLASQPELSQSNARRAHPPHTAILFVPGALESRLRTREDKREIWPGPASKLIFSRFRVLALPASAAAPEPPEPDSEAYDLFDGVGDHHYDGIWHRLEAGGYRRGVASEPNPAGEPQYYVFVYDWRRDLVASAAELDRFVEQIRRDYSDPQLKVDIVAYSMGALVARYFLLYGDHDVLNADVFHPTYAGAAKTRSVTVLGAPNAGSTSALLLLINGRRLKPPRLSAEVVATMPSVYQLLPGPDANSLITPQGAGVGADLYATDTWRQFQWSVFAPNVRKRIGRRFSSPADAGRYVDALQRAFAAHLARAGRFHRALSAPLPRTLDYTAFAGDCTRTLARLVLEHADGRSRVRTRPWQISHRARAIDYQKLMFEPGDGRVTRSSVLAPDGVDAASQFGRVGTPTFVCEHHRKLPANATVQEGLAYRLLTHLPAASAIIHYPSPAPVPPSVEVQLR